MCEMGNIKAFSLEGSARAADEWFKLGNVQVYHDHFIKAQLEEGIVVDFLHENEGEPLRICLEIDPGSARDLANAILETLESHDDLRHKTQKSLEHSELS